MADELRALIRELLSEEIAALRAEMRGAVQEERVRVGTAAELTEFARSVVRRASDPNFAAALREGQVLFLPEPSPGPAILPPARALSPVTASTIVTTVPAKAPELMKPLITERDIAAVPEGERRLRISKTSRLTPLASDEARRRSITIERSAK
ncbi:hypothetical protein [Mesorhizobium sp.]|uniref:hypothetical protein n=1 Tax=Mesorhizobium sp. TaxID=1871066 RepID=UPI000FE8B233|nr:hypothetical protein [Mesorhizobium sp.]RWI16488.1 MAG: hypothetical protein EOQ94_27920 [Mesorhizobium sp.]RWN08516.1 MAG: hypothetical protein EOR88_28950 [Mesorhizobium sp.]RWN08666.1 MAG: hypothetical protein EOR87_20505 [Mesorhizobium sp.]TIO09890.1 MAG: hypothetical protein E5X93_28870 [Mesorhizobium sp.]TIQ97606.1 MAG: hypothetical protein E5X36_13830 [Mesorhizobium sp.]